MHLLVAQAEGHSALEKASWIVTIIAFGLGVLQLLIYWFGRNFPLRVRATGNATRMSKGQQIIRVVVELRSRTRDTQTVREILLFDPPNVVRRALRPWWYRKGWSATPTDCAGTTRLALASPWDVARRLRIHSAGHWITEVGAW